MNVAELIQKKDGKPAISFELSRPKNDKAAAKLDKVLDNLRGLEPDYVSVTFGAGGSTRQGSFELIEKLKKDKGLPTVGYIAGVGLAPGQIDECLSRFEDMGLETLFVIRGDPPTWEESYKPDPKSYSYASEIVEHIRAAKGDRFALGVAAYPEGHIEAESKTLDLEHLKAKVDKGADYVVAQYFYDNTFYYDFLEKARGAGIEVPIIPGVMPIYSVKMMENLAKVCGATITDEIRSRLAELPADDKKAVAALGVDIATAQCRDLVEHGVQGLHFYTMNRSKTVTSILQTLRSEGRL